MGHGLYVSLAAHPRDTGMTSKTRAKEVYDKRKQSLRDGTEGIRRQVRRTCSPLPPRSGSKRSTQVVPENVRHRKVFSCSPTTRHGQAGCLWTLKRGTFAKYQDGAPGRRRIQPDGQHRSGMFARSCASTASGRGFKRT